MTIEKKFTDFALMPEILEGVEALGFEKPTPIQEEAIPALLEGRDMIGRARTGSGKTAAFGLPLLQRVNNGRDVRALVLAPTRELANQVANAIKEFAKALPIRVLPIYGGASYDTQLRGLKRGSAVVVGTPGRVIDLIDRGALDLSKVEFFVLDEADEMLRMGFLEDVERVLEELPAERQIALFSATMPRAIEKVAKNYLRNPVQIQVEGSALAVDHIEQSFIRVRHREKDDALLRILAGHPSDGTLVFARTRVRCADAAALLIKNGISAEALHGDLNQGARERVLNRLRAKSLDVVVATDVAARGLDVQHLTHVINYDMPDNAETYTHRIGRTGRAGRAGTAISFVTPRERYRSRDFERDLGIRIKDARLPTDKEIAHIRRHKLLDMVQAELDGAPLETMKSWLLEMVIEREWSPEDLAAAALSLLSKELNFEISSQGPQRGSRSETTHEHKGDVNECEVVISLGRRDGLRPADIVGVFSNELGMPSGLIGRISLGSHRTFVGLSRSVADKLVKEYPVLNIRGTSADVSLNEKAGKPAPRRAPSQKPARAQRPNLSKSERPKTDRPKPTYKRKEPTERTPERPRKKPARPAKNDGPAAEPKFPTQDDTKQYKALKNRTVKSETRKSSDDGGTDEERGKIRHSTSGIKRGDWPKKQRKPSKKAKAKAKAAKKKDPNKGKRRKPTPKKSD